MYNICPNDLRWIGRIELSALPNNELRVLNIFLKTGESDPDQVLEDKAQLKMRNQSLMNYCSFG